MSWGVAEECSDKELFLHYIDAKMNCPALKAHFDEEKVYRHFSGIDDKQGV